MTRTYAQLKADSLAILQDASTVNFSSAEMDTFIMEASRERSLPPHTIAVSFTLESRRGTATSTSAGNLVDTTASQFLSTDVGKVVYNIYDRTWAIITGFTSATTVSLSKDIMALNEGYRLFNSGCTQNNQIDLTNIDDYLEVDRVEYPIGTQRNWEITGKVMTIFKDYIPNSQVVAGNPASDMEAVVWFKKRHLISQLTDFSATVTGTAAVAGATTLAMSSLQASGTIETGQELTIALTRGIYTVTSDATISSNTVSVTIYPALESAVAATTVVTLVQSTLTPTLEPLVAELAAGLAAVSKPMKLYQHSFDAVTAVGLGTTAMTTVAGYINAATADAASARVALTAATTQIAGISSLFTAATGTIALALSASNAQSTAIASMTSGIIPAFTSINTTATSYIAAATALTGSAKTQIDLMAASIQIASSAMTVGYGLLNTIPVGGGAGDYMAQANGDMSLAQAEMANGQAYLQDASAQLNIANTYFGQANALLRVASEYAQQGYGDSNNAASYVNVANADIRTATEYLSQANTYHANAAQYLATAAVDLRSASERIEESNANMRKASTELQIVSSGRNLEAWGRNQLAETRLKLSRLMPTKYMTSKVHPKD